MTVLHSRASKAAKSEVVESERVGLAPLVQPGGVPSVTDGWAAVETDVESCPAGSVRMNVKRVGEGCGLVRVRRRRYHDIRHSTQHVHRPSA